MTYQSLAQLLRNRTPRNFIKEIRAEQAEARKQDPSYRKLPVRSLSTETRLTSQPQNA